MGGEWVMWTAAVLAGMAGGAGMAWWLARASHSLALAQADARSGAQLAQLHERVRQSEEARREDAVDRLAVEEELDAVRGQLLCAVQDASALRAELQAERSTGSEKLALLQQARQALSDQFKVLAGEILEDKSRRFADQNQASLGALLEPLKTQLSDFKAKVEEVYVQEGKDRSALAEQVRQLHALNTTLSQEAHNLTHALKGNTQAQGAWGELILETVLESSGLRRGEQFLVQDTRTREDGSTARPDVVILLPQGRKLVVDSKVSLVAYDEHCSAASDADKAQALKRHLQSMRSHIAGLSAREYQKMYPSLDFVLMFVPLEPAFMTAVANDKRLFMDAWSRNVLLVSPSTLLFVVRTVAHLWQQEAQSRHAVAIGQRGAALYDKLVDFVRDLEQVGHRLDAARAAYDEAHKRLSTGRGNVIWQAETLRQLGVKAGKSLPAALVDGAGPDLAAAEELAAITIGNTPHTDSAGSARMPPQ